jgi:hypothetical protein
MAEIGKLIDVKKPENYKTGRGKQVLQFKYFKDGIPGLNKNFTIQAIVEDSDGVLTIEEYTDDGFFYCIKNTSIRDLVEINPPIKEETKKRKVIQVALCSENEVLHTIALCDDGTMFWFCNGSWIKTTEIPQD